MGLGDKISNKAEQLKGKIKEAAGKSTDNERLERKGKAEQGKADIRQAGEKIKDAAKNLFKH